MLPSADLLPLVELLSSKLPFPTLFAIAVPCLTMPSFKVPFHQHSFIIHELDLAISFPLTTFVMSPIKHPTSSFSVRVESPMSSDKHADLNDLPNIKSNPNLLYQCPLPQKLKKSYDYTCKFQLKWATKFPWAKIVLVVNGILHNVWCRVYNTINRKPLLVAPKWDTFMFHEGRKKAHKDLP